MEYLDTWIIYSLRNVLNNPDLRNKILKKNVSNSHIDEKEIVYDTEPGKITHTGDYEDEELYTYLFSNIFKNDNKIHAFTLANKADESSGETHFQTFIVDNEKKIIYGIDPARTNRGPGIYDAIAGDYLKEQIEKKLTQYKFQWAVPNRACQRSSKDVFCQSWSLLLQMDFLKNNLAYRIELKPKQKELYSILIEFYKENYKLICPYLRNHYLKTLKERKDGDFGDDQKISNDVYKNLKSINICARLCEFNVEDFM